jgi:hypothetical protein
LPYQTPDADIVSIIDAPPTPLTLLAPGGNYVALVHYEAYPAVAVLARPHLSLAGLRIDPVIAGRQRVRRLTGLSVLRLSDGREQALELPAGASASVPTWAPDGRRLAFTVDESDGVGVWVAGFPPASRARGGGSGPPPPRPAPPARCRACGFATSWAATRPRPRRRCAGPGTGPRCWR